MDGIGISIEGIGYPLGTGTANEAGTVWALEARPAPTDTSPDGADEYEWREGLVGPVVPSGVDVDPLTADLTVPGFSAELHCTQLIAQTLLARQDESIGGLLESIDKTATSFDVDTQALSAGDVIYVGAETMRVTAAVKITGGATLTVTRAYRDSLAERHGLGAGVYTRPPFYRNRLVTLWTHDGATMRRRARGYLAGMAVGNGGTTIQLDIEDPLGALQDVRRLRSQPDLVAEGVVQLDRVARIVNGRTIWVIDIAARDQGVEWTSTIAKAFDASGTSSASWYEPIFVSVGGGIAIANSYTPLEQEFGGLFQGNSIDVDFSQDGSQGGTSEDPTYEVAVWRNAPVLVGGSTVYPTPYQLSDLEAVVENPWHPVVIAGILLCSTDSDTIDATRLDLLNGALGAGVDWLFGDVGIQAFIDIGNTDRETQIDQLILGFDGEPVNVFEEAIKLMRSAGYYFAYRDDGYIEPKKFDLLDVDVFATVSQYRIAWGRDSADWTWDPGYGEALQEYTGLLGETPMYDGFSLTSLGVGASARIDKLSEIEASDISFPYWRNDQGGREYVEAFLLRRVMISRSTAPIVTFRVHDESIDVGDWIRLDTESATDAIVFDEDGTPKKLGELSSSYLTVLVTGRTPRGDFNGYDIVARAYMYGQQLGRFRAPSAEVLTWDGGTDTITVSTSSQFGSDQSDENGFTVGQQVQLYDSNLALRATAVETVDAIGTQTITLSGDFGGLTPVAGDILELATYDNYTFTDFGAERGYCFLADASDLLGTADDPADEWQ